MQKQKNLSKRQLAVLGDLFEGDLDESAVLAKYEVGDSLYR